MTYLPTVTICGGFPHGGSQIEILKEQFCPQFKQNNSFSNEFRLIKSMKKPKNNIKMYLQSPLKVFKNYDSHLEHQTPMDIFKSWQV